MAVVKLNDAEIRQDFFQERIMRTLEHWQSHAAVQNVEVAVLDRKRELADEVASARSKHR